MLMVKLSILSEFDILFDIHHISALWEQQRSSGDSPGCLHLCETVISELQFQGGDSHSWY